MGQPEALLDGLEPGRDYEVSVQSLRGPEVSEVRSINARTSEYPSWAMCSYSRCLVLFFSSLQYRRPQITLDAPYVPQSQYFLPFSQSQV